MAVTAANKTNSGQSGGTSFVTASITPGANKLMILGVRNALAAGVPNVPTVTGNGLTWVQIATVLDTAGTGTRRLTLFRALGASPSAGTVTIDFAGQTQANGDWTIEEFDNIDTSGTNGSGAVLQSGTAGQTATTNTGITATLSALASALNASYGYIVKNAASGPTAGSGYTELHLFTTVNRAESEWKINGGSPNWTWSSESTSVTAIGIEIKAAEVKAMNGLALASVKTVKGLAIASVKKILGIR